MSRAIAITRRDLTAAGLRAAAGRTKDARAARRMLAIALVLDGADRRRRRRPAGWTARRSGTGCTATMPRGWPGSRTGGLGAAAAADAGADGGLAAGSRPAPIRPGTGWCAGGARTSSAGSRRPSGSRCTSAPWASIWRRSAIAGSRCVRAIRRPTRGPGGFQKSLRRSGSGGAPRARQGQAARDLVPGRGPVGQQGTLTRIWAKRGSRPRAPRDTRYEWAYIFGAVCPARGVAAGLVLPFVDTAAMNAHLAEIAIARHSRAPTRCSCRRRRLAPQRSAWRCPTISRS